MAVLTRCCEQTVGAELQTRAVLASGPFSSRDITASDTSHLAWSHIHHLKFIFVNASAKAAVELFNSSAQSALGRHAHRTQSQFRYGETSHSDPRERGPRGGRNPLLLLRATGLQPQNHEDQPYLAFLREQKD